MYLRASPSSPAGYSIVRPVLCSCVGHWPHVSRHLKGILRQASLPCTWLCCWAAGKPTVAYMQVVGEFEYYLASACDEIYIPPSAYISLRGLAVQGAFLGGELWERGHERTGMQLNPVQGNHREESAKWA